MIGGERGEGSLRRGNRFGVRRSSQLFPFASITRLKTSQISNLTNQKAIRRPAAAAR